MITVVLDLRELQGKFVPNSVRLGTTPSWALLIRVENWINF
jgi:hypothetical protein